MYLYGNHSFHAALVLGNATPAPDGDKGAPAVKVSLPRGFTIPCATTDNVGLGFSFNVLTGSFAPEHVNLPKTALTRTSPVVKEDFFAMDFSQVHREARKFDLSATATAPDLASASLIAKIKGSVSASSLSSAVFAMYVSETSYSESLSSPLHSPTDKGVSIISPRRGQYYVQEMKRQRGCVITGMYQ